MLYYFDGFSIKIFNKNYLLKNYFGDYLILSDPLAIKTAFAQIGLQKPGV